MGQMNKHNPQKIVAEMHDYENHIKNDQTSSRHWLKEHTKSIPFMEKVTPSKEISSFMLLRVFNSI